MCDGPHVKRVISAALPSGSNSMTEAPRRWRGDRRHGRARYAGKPRSRSLNQFSRLFIHARRMGRASGEDHIGWLVEQAHQTDRGLDRREIKGTGRQGISTRSATSTALLAALSAWGGVSITMKVAPWRWAASTLAWMRGGALSMTSGALSARHAPHWLAVACGSVSMMSATAPAASAAAGSLTGWFCPSRPSG
jgi:hypothetical protein